MNISTKDVKGYTMVKACILIACFFIGGNMVGSLYFHRANVERTSKKETLVSEIRSKTNTMERFKIQASPQKTREVPGFKDLAMDPQKKSVYSLKDVPNVDEEHPSPAVYKFDQEDAFLSSAFIDFRFATRYIRTFVIHKMEKSLDVYCHVKRTNGSSVSVKSSHEDIFRQWPENNVYIATGYFCELPESILTRPSNVQFSLGQKGKRFGVKLIPVAPELMGSKDRNDNVGACIKSITGEFSASQIIEWTELHKLIGINFFTFFNASLSGKGNDVLKYYVNQNQAQLVEFPLMSHVMDYENNKKPLNRAHFYSIQQQLYLISIQDCLYRLINRHKHILLVDMDELLTPYKQESVQSLLSRAWKANTIPAAILFSTGWYFDDFQQADTKSPKSVLNMVNRNRRTEIQDNNQPKSIINSDKCIQANWHGVVTAPSWVPINSLNNHVSYKNYGYIHHFRGPCIEKFYSKDCKKKLQNSVQDEILGRYIPEMEKNVQNVRNAIKL